MGTVSKRINSKLFIYSPKKLSKFTVLIKLLLAVCLWNWRIQTCLLHTTINTDLRKIPRSVPHTVSQSLHLKTTDWNIQQRNIQNQWIKHIKANTEHFAK